MEEKKKSMEEKKKFPKDLQQEQKRKKKENIFFVWKFDNNELSARFPLPKIVFYYLGPKVLWTFSKRLVEKKKKKKNNDHGKK